MMRKIVFVILLSALFTGCASVVPMESKEGSVKAKQFAPPQAGNSGLYIYRDSFIGKAIKRDILVNGKCVGKSAPDVFFYTEVAGGKEHSISTESSFSPNAMMLFVEAGKNYFVRQYITLGPSVGIAGLESIPEEQGKAAVAKLDLAIPGTCSQ